MANSMINYYKSKMEKAYNKYQEALDSGDEKGADKCMKDYLNYQTLYNGKR